MSHKLALATRILVASAVLLFASAAVHAQTPTGTPPSTLSTVTPASPFGGSGTCGGYNLYRAPGGTTTYVKLNATPISCTAATYTDTTVVNGTPYTYCATALDSTSKESACSAAKNITPTGVNPPSLAVQ